MPELPRTTYPVPVHAGDRHVMHIHLAAQCIGVATAVVGLAFTSLSAQDAARLSGAAAQESHSRQCPGSRCVSTRPRFPLSLRVRLRVSPPGGVERWGRRTTGVQCRRRLSPVRGRTPAELIARRSQSAQYRAWCGAWYLSAATRMSLGIRRRVGLSRKLLHPRECHDNPTHALTLGGIRPVGDAAAL